MDVKVFHQSDVDPSVLEKKTIAIIGYGAQGHAHAQNLRDSGFKVIVGQRPGPGFELALSQGFQPVSVSEAAEKGDIVSVLLPDEVHGPVFQKDILPNLQSGNVLVACHGFSYTYNTMRPPKGVDYVLVAPKGAGHQVRGQFVAGGGCPCLIGAPEGTNEESFQIGLAYAAGLGGARAGIIQTEIDWETETDLFGEQVVLCGGVSELIKAAFETLVEAGYPKELAYFECLHELMLTVDLIHRGGLSYMRDMISNTAEYGDYCIGERIVDDSVRLRMKKILQEIQAGDFAKKWLNENEAGQPEMKKRRIENREHPIEEVGQELRKLMPWLETKDLS